MLEAILEAAAVMAVDLVLGTYVLAAHLPEEGMELVLVAILLEVVQYADFFTVSLEVGPNVPVDGDNHLAAQVLCHTQHIDGGHLVLHTDGVLTEGAEGHINVVVLAVLCKINGEVGVAGVADVAAGGLDQVVDCLVIHIRGATTSFSMSSTNQVPYSGKVLMIHLSRVISEILLILQKSTLFAFSVRSVAPMIDENEHKCKFFYVRFLRLMFFTNL